MNWTKIIDAQRNARVNEILRIFFEKKLQEQDTEDSMRNVIQCIQKFMSLTVTIF